MPPARRGRLSAVDDDGKQIRGALKPIVPPRFDGGGLFTMQSYSSDTPLYALGLKATEWAVIDWLRENGAASAAIQLTVRQVGQAIGSNEQTVKVAFGRLVKMGIVLRIGTRSSTYQLTPRRFWEGDGRMQNIAAARLDPPAIQPVEKTSTRRAKGEN